MEKIFNFSSTFDYSKLLKMKMDIEEIKIKVKEGKELTREEELLNLIKVRRFTKREALRIFAINDNKNPNLFVD